MDNELFKNPESQNAVLTKFIYFKIDYKLCVIKKLFLIGFFIYGNNKRA